MSGILAQRYASAEMREIWSRESKILMERELWLEILATQKSIGLNVEESVIDDYRRVLTVVNLSSIDTRELKLQHDVMARIEEFNALAGHQRIHIGMTSRDLTENIELAQLRKSLTLVIEKSKQLISNAIYFAELHQETAMVARTHNVPAQVTTLGRRFCIWIEEILFALEHLQQLLERLPIRGIKGAIGTGQDMKLLFGDHASEIDLAVSKHLGFKRQLTVSAQIYPRSIDYEILTTLLQISAGPSNIATNIRLMASHSLLSEGFEQSQVGSSAMPHKMNPRLSERINGLTIVLKGFATMLQNLLGDQWNEGDVSCSVVRRVALPDAFHTVDAILDTTIRVIQGLQVNAPKMERELEEQLPFLVSSRILALAVEKGVGREDAHSKIKEYSMQARINTNNGLPNNFFNLIQSDSQLGITSNEIEEICQISAITLSARSQVSAFIKSVRDIHRDLPDSKASKPSKSI